MSTPYDRLPQRQRFFLLQRKYSKEYYNSLTILQRTALIIELSPEYDEYEANEEPDEPPLTDYDLLEDVVQGPLRPVSDQQTAEATEQFQREMTGFDEIYEASYPEPMREGSNTPQGGNTPRQPRRNPSDESETSYSSLTTLTTDSEPSPFPFPQEKGAKSRIIYAALLDGGKVQTYNFSVNKKIDKAWKALEKNTKATFKTIGGTFLYIFEFDQTLDRHSQAAKIQCGEQINTVSGTRRPLMRYNLFLLGSPTGALWYSHSMPSVDTENDDDDEKNEKKSNNNQKNARLYHPLVCVALEMKFREGRTQALILGKGEQPYIVKFPQADTVASHYNIVTDDTYFVSRQTSEENFYITRIELFKLKTIKRANKLFSILMKCIHKTINNAVLEDEDLVVATKSELKVFLKKFIPNIEDLVVKDNETPVLESICEALRTGVAGLNGEGGSTLAALSCKQLRYNLAKLMEGKEVTEEVIRMLVEQLVDSWTSCAAEQVREVDRQYGILSGRELSFPQQVLLALDRYKELILNKLAIWMGSTVSRGTRFPHLLNRLRVDLSQDLGLSSVTMALQDPHIAPMLSPQLKQLALAKFYELFNAMDFVRSIMVDVNVQSESVERIVYAKTLLHYAQEKEKEGKGFNAHCILYNENEKDFYDVPPVNDKDVYLHPGTTLDVIEVALNAK
eukprot:m.274400 g.274400  ORF g.274400 m.274400 type:complete len:678 (+) comp16288_c1_seq2:323-2356(+)